MAIMEFITQKGMFRLLKNILVLACMGALLSLALPPSFYWLTIPISLSYLFYAVQKASSCKQAFFFGLTWACGFFGACYQWLYGSLAMITALPQIEIVLGTSFFVFLYALPTAIATMLYARFQSRNSWINWVLFSSLCGAAELVRGHGFAASAWGALGYSWGASIETIQAASLVGVFGLSWVTWLMGTSFAQLWPVSSFVARRAYIAPVLMIGLLAVAYGWGANRVQHAQQNVSDVTIRLIQIANIPINQPWSARFLALNLNRHEQITVKSPSDNVKVIIWPETAIPAILALPPPTPSVLKHLSTLLKPGQFLISGIMTLEEQKLYNTLIVTNHQGEVVGHYNKNKLVPVGEKIPFDEWLPFKRLTVGGHDRVISIGKQRDVIDLGAAGRVAPMICYESTFPEFGFTKTKADWMLNISNDEWLTERAVFQHQQMARFRAVEQGLPMVLDANYGISTVWDGYGREIAHLDSDQSNHLDVRLPKPLSERTVFSKLGTVFP